MHVTGLEDLRKGLAENWSRVQEIPLSTLRAHDLLVSTPVANTNKFHEEGFWYCRSSNNEIGHHPSGTTVRLEKPHFTRNNKVRGLSESEQHLLVGHGRVRKHKHPTHFPHRGSIAYIDKASLRQTHQIEVPELPCCLIKNPWYRAPSRV